MKIGTAVLTLVFVVYAGIQSFDIASLGADYGIPQLEGDGGGGLLFAALCLLAGITVLIKPFAAMFVYSLATLLGLFVGLTYGDNLVCVWSAAPLILAGVSVYVHRRESRRIRHSIQREGTRKGEAEDMTSA